MIYFHLKQIACALLLLTLFSCTGKSNQQKDEVDAADQAIPTLESGIEKPMPDVWTDKDTGHRISKLTRQNMPSKSFYFHNNPFIHQSEEDGDLMIFYGMTDGLWQLFSINLKTLETQQLTSHQPQIRGEIVAANGRAVIYQSNDSIFSTSVDTKEEKLLYVFLDDFKAGITSLNADETLLAGTYADPIKDEIYEKNPKKSDYFTLIYEAHIPHTLFTININTGELKKLYSENAWLNHVQFSPTNPNLLMYDHEGPWHLVDRIWTINLETGNTKLMHKRAMPMEIAGHEFFGRDGKVIWFDLQKPRSQTFFLAGRNIEAGALTTYQMKREEWSIHFNISPDQKLFAGDGGDSTQVAHAKNGHWIYLFTPQGDSLSSEKLVNMKHHGYRPLEPNVHFSPDGKHIIFRSDMDGITRIYQVDI